MRRLAALALLASLAACSSEPAAVDWSRYSDEWGQSVRDAAAGGDCDAMFSHWEAAMGADDEALEAYVEGAMERAECPGW